MVFKKAKNGRRPHTAAGRGIDRPEIEDTGKV